MKIERQETMEEFKDVAIGEVFSASGSVYLRIEADGDYTNKRGHDGLAVDLFSGVVTFFHDYEEVVISHNAKVIY